MDRNIQANELHEAYVKAQKLLWDRWMEIAQQFEIASAPESAWWSLEFRVLDEQAQEVKPISNVDKAWLQLWCDGLDQRQGVIAAMIEWNRRIIEHQVKANQAFLTAWSETVRSFGEDSWDKPTEEAFEALQDAITRALEMSLELSPIQSTNQAGKPALISKGFEKTTLKKRA